MSRLCALLLLAGIAVSARPRPAAAVVEPAVRPLTPDECRLLFMRSPSKALH